MIYGSKHGKYWFSHIFHCYVTTMVSTEVKLWFLSSLEHFWPDPYDTLSEVALFFEKMHKVFKNKALRCSAPLIQLKKKTTKSNLQQFEMNPPFQHIHNDISQNKARKWVTFHIESIPCFIQQPLQIGHEGFPHLLQQTWNLSL